MTVVSAPEETDQAQAVSLNQLAFIPPRCPNFIALILQLGRLKHRGQSGQPYSFLPWESQPTTFFRYSLPGYERMFIVQGSLKGHLLQEAFPDHLPNSLLPIHLIIGLSLLLDWETLREGSM